MNLYSVVAGAFLLLVLATGALVAAAPKDKDKEPPIISELTAHSVTQDAAVISWLTDEPADSAIRYGIVPKTNINGPSDDTLVLSHAIALGSLASSTEYAFCVESRDEANNKAEACGSFTTLSEEPEPAVLGGGGLIEDDQVALSGYAYPGADVRIVLQPLPFGRAREVRATANFNGAFSVEIENPPRGLQTYLISATDERGVESVRKGIQFEWRRGDAPLFKDPIILPPTIALERELVAWGDDITVGGSATPRTGVLVQFGDVWYETKSDDKGTYEMAISSARQAAGKESLRARTSLISELGYDYSFTKTVTISGTSVPQADLNGDSVVDLRDFSIFLASPRDLNNDKAITSADLSIFLRAFKITP